MVLEPVLAVEFGSERVSVRDPVRQSRTIWVVRSE
jgi:hypothetical protein